MSLAKLFVSGLLVAGGLILGAFTLHGYFDPQWAQKQVQAAGAQERPKDIKAVINTFQGRSRFVSRNEPSPSAERSVTPTHTAVTPAVARTADTKPAAKPVVKKKVAEKPKPAPQQQASVWPWSLFGN